MFKWVYDWAAAGESWLLSLVPVGTALWIFWDFFFLDDEKDEKRSILGRIDIYTEAHWDDCNNLS